MISKDYILLLVLGIIVVLAVVAALETFDTQAKSETEDKSREAGNWVDCAFAENPEKCRTSTKVEVRTYET